MNKTKEITEAPKDCGDSGSIWETGKNLFEYDYTFTLDYDLNKLYLIILFVD